MAGIQFIYHSPTTPGNPGFSVDLTDVAQQQGVRLGTIGGLQTEAELGAVAQSALVLDDPTGTAGHSSDAIVGLKQLSVNEGRAPSGNRRIGEFYIADRRYYRGNEVSPSLRTGAARLIDMTLSDINSFLSFRILRTGTANGSNTSFNRPAETDVERITALLAIPFLSTTLFDGLVSSANPVDMDANDYQGQTAADVLNDCAQQSGKNFFVFYDEAGTYTPSAGDFGLFYDFNDSTAYPSYDPAFQVSNVLTDISRDADGKPVGPIWEPMIDAVLTRDPSRVISGMYFANGSNSVYVENPTTSYAFGWRDAVGNTQNLKTVAQMRARGNRYLQENSTEDDRISFTLKLPAANVNDWKEGQWAQVKFSHLPDYGSFTSVRCLSRTVAQDETNLDFYNVHYECGRTPIPSSPSGAMSLQINGVGYSGQPTLISPTTPGNVLFMFVVGRGNVSKFPTDVRMKDNPAVSPASPEVPPFTDHAGWTLLGPVVRTDYSGMNIGGPCSGFNPVPYCTSCIVVAAAWRYVQPGEVTTVPVQVSTDETQAKCAAWLWELPPTAVPTLLETIDSTHGSPLPVSPAFTSDPGNVVGLFAFYTEDSGHEKSTVTPHGTAVNVQSNTLTNDPTTEVFGGWEAPWVWVGQLEAGGALGLDYSPLTPTYTSINYCGISVVLPAGVTLPGIPYPANSVGP